MIYVYCQRDSEGAEAIVTEINATGGRAARLRYVQPTEPGLVVCWGASYPKGWPTDGFKFLNKDYVGDKLTELCKLRDAGVPVPDFGEEPRSGWLARLLHHREASDLLRDLREGDYYVEYVPCDVEFRIHVVDGVSARAGLKVPRTDDPHPRFRAWRAGWKITYGGACQRVLTQAVRDVAKAAVRAVGYDFGAVDVVLRRDGRPVVLEVNSAPGLEGRTVEVYAKKFTAICSG